MRHNEKFVSEDIFEDENVPKHNLKSMMLNNDDYDDSHTSQFDLYIFISHFHSSNHIILNLYSLVL